MIFCFGGGGGGGNCESSACKWKGMLYFLPLSLKREQIDTEGRWSEDEAMRDPTGTTDQRTQNMSHASDQNWTTVQLSLHADPLFSVAEENTVINSAEGSAEIQ